MARLRAARAGIDSETAVGGDLADYLAMRADAGKAVSPIARGDRKRSAPSRRSKPLPRRLRTPLSPGATPIRSEWRRGDCDATGARR